MHEGVSRQSFRGGVNSRGKEVVVVCVWGEGGRTSTAPGTNVSPHNIAKLFSSPPSPAGESCGRDASPRARGRRPLGSGSERLRDGALQGSTGGVQGYVAHPRA